MTVINFSSTAGAVYKLVVTVHGTELQGTSPTAACQSLKFPVVVVAVVVVVVLYSASRRASNALANMFVRPAVAN